MLKSIRVSLKDSLVYGLGNIAVKVVGFVLIPLYTDPEFFSVNEFGIMALLDISGLVLISIMASGLPQSLMRWYWDKDHKANQQGIFFMSLLTQIIVSLVLCLLLIPLSGTFSEMLFRKTSLAGLLTLVIIASTLQVINNIISTLMRLQSRSVLYTATNLSKLAIVLLLTLYFIIEKRMGLMGIYLAQVIGNGFYIVASAVYTVKNCKVYFNLGILREMNVYGFPLLLANISAVLLNVIDRFALNSLSALKFVAVYTFAFKISSVLKLVIVDSVKLALAPIIYRKIDSPDNKRFYSKALLYSSYVLMIGIIAVSLFSREIISLISGTDEYLDAVALIPALSLAIFFINMKEITVYGLHIAKKTKIIGTIVTLATITSLALNLLLIPLWDMAGAAVATLLSQLIYLYACYYFSQKEFFIPYESRKVLVLFLTGSVLSLSSFLINKLDPFPSLVIKISMIACFPFILYLFNFYESVEIKAIKGFVRKWKDLRKFRENLKSLSRISDDL